jgi:predicted ATPase
LLETTRAYAMEKLRDAGEVDALAGRHASNLCERFERHPPAWLQLPDAAWRSDCLPELDNVRAALDWTIALAHDPALGIRLASASAAIWPILSLQREGRRRLEAAVEHMNAETPQPEQARLWLWVGLMRAMESPAESTFAFERAVELYRALGDSTALGYALLRLGGRLARIGRTADAEPILAQAQPLLERADSPKLLADCLTAFGFLRLQLGDLAGARDAYQRAVPLFERSGGVDQVLNLTGNLADVSWALGDMEAAEAGYREAIRMARTIPHAEDRIRGVHLTALAGLLAVRGELVASLAVAREGLPLLERSGCAWYNLDYLALRAALAGKLGNAARIAGYQDAAFAAKATVRQVLEARAREHVQTLLREGLAADDLARLLAEGAKLAEHEVCRLALEE